LHLVYLLMKIHSAAIALLSSLVALSEAQEVRSPNGSISVTLKLEEGALEYSVTHKGRTFLDASPLGLESSIGSFASGLKADGSKSAKIDERYTLPHGKVREVHYEANEMTARFTNSKGDALDVIFRVSDRDVAFAYQISGRAKQRIVVLSERTGFDFPASATAFVTQQVPGGGGFAGSKPSYEEGYLMDVAVGTKAKPGLGFTFPALFRIGSDGWALVSETGVTSGYVGTRLANPTPEGLYTIAFPDKSENSGVGETTVSATLPLLTPWRTITIGETLASIVETTVATDVVKPAYEPSREYKPGRVTWSWLLWQDASMNEKDQRTFIDLAATMGYEYILIDALWDKNIGREKMAELVAYARSKKVGVNLWYNSNGSWNDAPQSPRNRMHTAPARQDEMAWLQKIGVVGMKVDFFGGDKQTTMKLYEDILTDANRYGLMLNFHGATLPRGWERIYPNHMTSEAVTASENLVFSKSFADREAFNSTVFPFVRNPVAAMDYGPMVLNKRFSRDPNRGNPRVTTDAFQLATTVTYQSPLQHSGLTPNNLQEQPDFVIDFLKRVPSVWDETRFIDGYPGKLFAVARRSGGKWYLAVTNGESAQKEWSVSNPLLKDQEFNVIHDKPDGSAATRKLTVGPDGKLSLSLGPNGGAVLFQ
jgi:Glycoside hydrolase 97/Glycosyl-hydrolase 97 N-terminal/Glycosyl-hydrolase 97 C-terminal, oligomerisation